MANHKGETSQFATAAAPIIERAFKQLLEDKHLYQSVEIGGTDLSDYIDQLLQRYHSEIPVVISAEGGFRSENPYRPRPDEERVREYTEQAKARLRELPYLKTRRDNENQNTKQPVPHEDFIAFFLPTVKTYCSNRGCGGMWPHNPFPDLSYHMPTPLSGIDLQQIFVLHYQCQSCKGEPVTFLVKRDGLKLTLCGRSPMEKVAIPSYIPKQVRRLYRGAVIAFNSGAILPSLFMLRTTIEQHMRNAIGAGDERITGDELADKYAETLPDDFKTRFPSLKLAYGALSEAIHAAQDDNVGLFERERGKILAHLEAKDTFERLSVLG